MAAVGGQGEQDKRSIPSPAVPDVAGSARRTTKTRPPHSNFVEIAMNAQEIVLSLKAAGAEMVACCDRIDARDREIEETMDHYRVNRDFTIQMIHWSRNRGPAMDQPRGKP